MAKAKVSHLQETQKSDQQLGTLIAAVLNHPDLPEGVYNSIGDSLAELQSRPGLSSRPESIQAVIDSAKESVATAKAERQKSDQTSTVATQKLEAKAKAAVEKYEEERDKEPKSFTFTEKEFEEFGLLMQSVFDLSNSLGEHLDEYNNGGGLNHCLHMVARGLDHLYCEVQERSKGGAA